MCGPHSSPVTEAAFSRNLRKPGHGRPRATASNNVFRKTNADLLSVTRLRGEVRAGGPCAGKRPSDFRPVTRRHWFPPKSPGSSFRGGGQCPRWARTDLRRSGAAGVPETRPVQSGAGVRGAARLEETSRLVGNLPQGTALPPTAPGPLMPRSRVLPGARAASPLSARVSSPPRPGAPSCAAPASAPCGGALRRTVTSLKPCAGGCGRPATSG